MKEFNENMTKEEQLREGREELFFKMMFAAFEKTDAPKYEALNEQLKKDPAYQTTEEEDKAMLDFIAREIKKRDEELAKHEREKQASITNAQKKPGRRIMSILTKVAVVAILLMLVTATAYATIPSFRVMTLNLLLEASGEATRVGITDRTERSDSKEKLDGNDIVLLGYSFPGVPEGFNKEEEYIEEDRAWVRYENKQGKTIKYQIYYGIELDIALDTEDAEVRSILVNENDGLLSIKDNNVRVSWYEEENKAFFIVDTKGFETKDVFRLANEVVKAE